MISFGERCYSNQYDEISDDEFSDDEISGFANTTKFPTTKFLTTKFPPLPIWYRKRIERNIVFLTMVGENCQVLMVITDGADGEAKDAYGKISDEVLDSVRIFTYVEGSSVYEDDSLSWIACRNRGFFHKVPTKEAVRMQAMEYLQVACTYKP